jgi:ArsR family transcriptional regulator
MDILPRQRLMVATAHRNQSTAIAKFKALSDPIRLQVIELLRQQEMCVCDLCDHIGVAQSKLSFHLKTLREAGLLHSRQQGRWIYYSLNLREFLELEEYLAEIRRFSTMLPAKVCE